MFCGCGSNESGESGEDEAPGREEGEKKETDERPDLEPRTLDRYGDKLPLFDISARSTRTPWRRIVIIALRAYLPGWRGHGKGKVQDTMS